MAETHAEQRKKPTAQHQSNRSARTPSAIGPQRGPTDTRQLIQRALADPSSLTAAEGAHLQRSIGNRAIGQILAASAAAKRAADPAAPVVQAKLTLGPAHDKYEQEADRTAKQVMRSLDASAPDAQTDATPNGTLRAKPFDTSLEAVKTNGMMRVAREYSEALAQRRQSSAATLQAKPLADGISRIQREEMEEDELQEKPLHGLEGGEVEPGVAATISRAKGGGAPLHDGVRASMERGFGADFSGVRVHTGGQADALNRSLNARAFTSGRDLFFRQGEYNPASRAGQQLLAHELTHTVQQNGSDRLNRQPNENSTSDHHIQRTAFNDKANGYYSQVLPGQKITQDNAVLTATAFEKIGGGHSSVYIESLSKENVPNDVKIHLTHDPTANETRIKLQPGFVAQEPKKRSWVKSAEDANKAIEKAQTIADEPQEKKKYRFFGGSLTRGGMNCAKFAERILKAAGIKASAGLIFKTPAQLATGKNKGHVNTLEEDTESYESKRKEELEKLRKRMEMQMNLFGEKDQNKKIEKIEPKSEEVLWLSTAKGTDFKLAKELPASPCRKDGTLKRQLIQLPADSHILVIGEGADSREVIIECIQPKGYYSVNLSLLFDSAPKETNN